MPELARSYLYVPGDKPQWMNKALGRGADAIILDLEDAVAPERKAEARQAVRELLQSNPTGPQLWVRVNGDSLEEDIEAVAVPALRGIIVPGADPQRLDSADRALTRAEQLSQLPRDHFRVVALIETAAALLRLQEVAGRPRVLRLAIGEADLAGELRLQPDEDKAELWPIRSSVVIASAAAGLAAPIGPVETVLDDEERLLASTRRQLRQGFRARTAVHPGQIATINAVFTPSQAEVARARDVVAAFDAAMSQGSGAVRGPGGQMLDAATIRSARETLARVGDHAGG